MNYIFSNYSELKEESVLYSFHFRSFVVLRSRCCYSARKDQHVSVQPSKGGGQAEGETKGGTLSHFTHLIFWDWICSQMRQSGWCYDPLILTFSPQSGLLSTFSLSMTDLSKSCENLSTVMLYNPGWVYAFTDTQLHVTISSDPAMHFLLHQNPLRTSRSSLSAFIQHWQKWNTVGEISQNVALLVHQNERSSRFTDQEETDRRWILLEKSQKTLQNRNEFPECNYEMICFITLSDESWAMHHPVLFIKGDLTFCPFRKKGPCIKFLRYSIWDLQKPCRILFVAPTEAGLKPPPGDVLYFSCCQQI